MRKSTRVARSSIVETCAKLVQNLRMIGGKKCVRLSPESYTQAGTNAPGWITIVFPPHDFTAFYTPLSTRICTIAAPVRPLVLPIFHSTYNNHHQFI